MHLDTMEPGYPFAFWVYMGSFSVQAELSHSMSTKRQVHKCSGSAQGSQDHHAYQTPIICILVTWIHKFVIPGYHGAWLLMLIPVCTRGDFTS